MNSDLSKFLAVQPAHQRVIISLITPKAYPPAIWELIGHRITNILLENEHLTALDDAEATGSFKRIRPRLWSFEIKFEIMNACSLFELDEVKDALYAFLFQIGARSIESVFESVD